MPIPFCPTELRHLARALTKGPATDAAVAAWLAELGRRRGAPLPLERVAADAVRSDGHRLHLDVVAAAEPARATVVFMPGTNAYGLLYSELLVALADRGFHVVAFDPRGHGRSEGARGSYTLDELLRDMDAVVGYARRRFGDPMVVSGSSQGGITAFYYAAGERPVAAAVCHNLADLGHPDAVRLTRFPRLGRALRSVLPTLARLAPELPVPLAAYLDLAAEPVRGVGSALEVIARDPLLAPSVRLKTLASLGHTPLPRPLAAIDTPILVLQAGADAIFPTDYVAALVARLSAAELKLYPDLPHYMIVDHVDRYIDDVATWLASAVAKERG